ncbi:MAG TPA: hypothetical protein VNV25_04790 [Gemmatimonadaceae bacterium]|jgi:hypothetical protein|nr:hypothetical protein [Gemmatimonadaceae bacterium]
MGFAGVAGAQTDPRVGLAGGHYVEAADASSNMQLIAHKDRPQPFFNPGDPGDFYVINSDLAFRDNLVFQGNFYGIQIWDVADIRNPVLKTSLVCPGGQGDPSVYGNLMFMSVEMPNGRVDCGTQGVKDTVSPDRFRGVRIFDISDVEHPKQIAAVQTCRGSHTHTLIPDPKDKNVLWVYVQGLVPPRPAGELAGCSGAAPEQDPNTSLFRIDIIKVPLDHPQDAKVVAGPRIFALSGQINGLWKGGKHGEGTQETNPTDQCHDITAYPAIGLAAGACSGNGILLDITNPGEPKRVGEVTDPNFAYFHSATFSNDGKKVIFTDEWGGGTLPRCRASDPKNWGADAIFSIGADHKLTLDGYFKMPAPQTETENCVAHNGSLVPVPGRDILAQGWYQGGVSIYDFTDPAHAQEIAFFDRGPLDTKQLYIAGDWAAYWYNGYVYGSEIARGLDIFELQPSQYLSKNEIDAAKLVKIGTSNPSDQPKIVWPAAFPVARAYLDQLERMNGLGADRITAIRGDLDKAEQMNGAQQKSALQKLAKQTEADAKNAKDAERVRWLTGTIKGIAGDKVGNGG